jgi:hypothetical protein
MSEENKEEVAEQAEVRGLTDLLETLVPPKNIEIEDIYGNMYKVSSSVSARNQILIMREFDKIKNMDTDAEINLDNMPNIIKSMISIATEENIFEALCSCFSHAHKKVVLKSIEYSKKEGDSLDHVGDLFAIEEIVSGIVPLFIRLARKTTKAIQVLS